MTQRQRVIFWSLAVIVAASRFLALSHSMWDWDEALFSSSIRHYDVASHHPHPPGFPLFVAMAKVAHLFIRHEFQALRAVNLLFSLCVFPALFALARALRFDFRSSVIAGLIFSFLPNVWFYGGTGFSDIPCIVLYLFGAALLLRDESCGAGALAGQAPRDELCGAGALAGQAPPRAAAPHQAVPHRAGEPHWAGEPHQAVEPHRAGEPHRAARRITYLAGCAFFAASMLIRPQNVLLIYPWAAASWRRLRGGRLRDVVAGCALIVAMIAVGYGAAAKVTGWREYVYATKAHQHYVASVDGSLNPHRTPLREIARDFIVDPFRAGLPSTVLFVFAALAFLRPRRRDFEIAATFLPNFVLAFFWLSATGVPRLSLGYIPMHALLAADGMAVAAWLLARNRERAAAVLQCAFAAFVIVRYIGWMRVPLAEVRKNDSPPVQAVKWVMEHEAPGGRVYVQGGMDPFAEYYLGPQYKLESLADDVDPSSLPPQRDTYYVSDHASPAPDAIVFRRPHRRLFYLVGRRYFETHVRPVGGRIEFVSGWYGEEGNEASAWRWMSGRSVSRLKGFDGVGELSMDLYAPIDIEPPPAVTVSVDGAVIDRFTVTQPNFRRKYPLQSRAGALHELMIEVDHVANPRKLHLGDDTRDLGLQLRRMTWKARP